MSFPYNLRGSIHKIEHKKGIYQACFLQDNPHGFVTKKEICGFGNSPLEAIKNIKK